MNFQLKEDKFHVRAFFAKCDCNCRFCCLGSFSKNKMISFEDYEKVMKKFSCVEKDYHMRLRSFIYNCPEHPYLKRQIQLYNSLPMVPEEYTQLDLNGTSMKSDIEIGVWLDELINAGVKKVAFSWFGLNDTHDAFVRRKGYFSYLETCAKKAHEKGIPVMSKVFLHKGIIDDIDQLIDRLVSYSDNIVCAFMEYSGNAKTMQEEFFTQQDYENLSEKTKSYIHSSYLKKFKTEKEWFRLAKEDAFPTFNIVDYILYVTSDNLQWVLETDIADIITYFRNMNRDFQQSFGSISALAQDYAEQNCECLYEVRDVLRKWLDRYYDKKKFDKTQLFSFTNNSVEWKEYERL